MSKIKTCGSCALRSQDGVHCMLTGQTVDPNLDYCSHHNGSPHICEICGKFIVSNNTMILDRDENRYHEICTNCYNALGTCTTCEKGNICLFEQSPISIPKVVNQQVRQGNMVMQTQVRNPERIRATCGAGCNCWGNNYCKKVDHSCEKYSHSYPS